MALLLELSEIELNDISTCEWDKQCMLMMFDIGNHSHVVLKLTLLILPADQHWTICIAYSKSIPVDKVQITDILLDYSFLHYIVLSFAKNQFVFIFDIGLTVQTSFDLFFLLGSILEKFEE